MQLVLMKIWFGQNPLCVELPDLDFTLFVGIEQKEIAHSHAIPSPLNKNKDEQNLPWPKFIFL